MPIIENNEENCPIREMKFSNSKCNKQFWLSLAEMSIIQISFIQHIHVHGHLQGQNRPEVSSDT